VPYNLFKLFLVHKISSYKYIYIYENRKWEKEKGFLSYLGRGEFLNQPGAGARAAAWAGGPHGPPVGETAWGRRGDGVVAWAHMPEEGG
jgi:hypothetical protein